MFLPAGNDSPNVKEGGLSRKILGDDPDKLSIVEYPEMKHGWTVRGDIGDSKVARDVVDAVAKGFAFLVKHMK